MFKSAQLTDIETAASTLGVPLEVELSAGSSSALPFAVANTAHVVATARSAGKPVEIRFPGSPPASLANLIEADPASRLLVEAASKLVGAGSRDLSPQFEAWRDVDQQTERERAKYMSCFVRSTYRSTALPDGSRRCVSSGIFDENIQAVQVALRQALVAARLPGTLPGGANSDVTVFLKEALDNVRQHASRSIADHRAIEGLEVASVRRLEVSAIESADPGTPAFRQFQQGLSSLVAKRGIDRENLVVVEISVVDSGEGIPATMVESLGIYERPALFERTKIDGALKPGGTRPSSRPSLAPSSIKGQGFTNMLSAVHRLQGFMRIWTGRTLLERSMVEAGGERIDFEPDSQTTLAWKHRETALVRGTSLTALLLVDLSSKGATDSLFD